ncbi:lysoplasmalogenase family protein [Sphingomonas sp. ZT3P38]|uniref:lysoplasmalogenase family protein n=1 Tax=Parasphingomonas zepuensis TaxID=3096161 RepID=UPI002FC5FF7C
MTETKFPPFPHFWLFPAAVIAGLSFWAASHLGLSGALFVAWKGICVGLLTLCAGLAARDRNGWLLTALLALGTLGDVVLETSGIVIGGVAFLAGHLVSILLYLSNRRKEGGAVAVAIALAIPAVAFAITRDAGATVYATGLGGMAGAAWYSRFPRTLVATGALMFAASDLLIFAELGPLKDSVIPALTIWPLYLGGQTFIAYGVLRTLEVRKRNEDLHHRL